MIIERQFLSIVNKTQVACTFSKHHTGALLMRTYIQRFCGAVWEMSLIMRKPAFCICENEDADQLPGNREADQRLCFRYTASTIPLLLKYKISSL